MKKTIIVCDGSHESDLIPAVHLNTHIGDEKFDLCPGCYAHVVKFAKMFAGEKKVKKATNYSCKYGCGYVATNPRNLGYHYQSDHADVHASRPKKALFPAGMPVTDPEGSYRDDYDGAAST